MRVNRRLFAEGIESHIIRLTARVRFRTVDGGWTSTHNAIIDPGSPYCMIPSRIWRAADHRLLVPRPLLLGGIGGGTVTALFGEVTLVVHDEVIVSPSLTIRAFLLPDDSEPLLLGFADFLTPVVLHCDYPQRQAYLEFRL